MNKQHLLVEAIQRRDRAIKSGAHPKMLAAIESQIAAIAADVRTRWAETPCWRAELLSKYGSPTLKETGHDD